MSRFVQLFAAMALAPGTLGATLIASHFAGGIYSLSLATSNSSGTLSITSQTTGCGTTPGWLQLYADSRKLYCFDESWFGSGNSAEYTVANDGRLTSTGQLKTTGNSVHGLLYGGSDGRGFVATAEQDVAHPHEVHLDPTGKFIIVPDLGADLIRIFKIDASSGKLTACSEGKADPGDGPRHIKFWKSADGLQKAYTVNELGNSVSAWDVAYPSDDAGCLSLEKTQTLSTFAPGKQGGPTTKAAELRVVGNFLYASNRADETFGSQKDSIATYTIDASTGEIAWLEAANSYSYYPRTFEFNKDGTLVAVGGQTSSNVAIIARDTETGKLGALVATLQVGQKGRAGEEDGLSAVVWVESPAGECKR
ncbi:hypothetical protein CHGG_09577 [Chaetomium globosum CBS 148.51]|uniref:6-phosphogluconolactonase n=1 Tax=Chaetomium globosum (strain ATCC 6205 / CBS 148.51 / DSM 1962 / NBRC 6347 / NRRL 1970) TaxID=306901 RepID=Q2GR27_CHAGB|nr:uncharacterized protein CHGG_09577 [Chaetomium globosum CBS 148.51]EAQ85563.1 hypothetical protein CHGG_09577 [Chaetomium globosum CBS 148.51]